jgi:hypothetical protein
VKYHHFRQFVDDGTIAVEAISTELQQADLLTKPLPELVFCLHRQAIMGW